MSSNNNMSGERGKPVLIEYFDFLKSNRNYRLYLIAHCMQHAGDWFIRIAALLSVERLAPDSSTAISVIIICKIIPEVTISPIGGILSDKYDRKYLMILLDIIGAITTLGFLVALRSGNVFNLYIATLLRSSISSMYEPVTKSIYPMFVNDPEDLKRAATFNTTAWSTMLLLGGLFSGYIISLVGVEACYAIDSITYLVSAIIMLQIHGSFTVKQGIDEDDIDQLHECERINCCQVIMSKVSSVGYGIKSSLLMSRDFIIYILSSGFALCALFKACATFTFGGQDVLNAAFTLVDGDEEETSRRLGIIFSCTGFGSLISPFMSNMFTQGNQPKSIQLACIGSFVFLAGGFFGIGASPNFTAICFFTTIRAMGEAIIWMNATMLLQTLTNPEMLGRMLSFEFSIARTTEAIMAITVGQMEDSGMDERIIALLSGAIGLIFLVILSLYHCREGGAAQKRFNHVSEGEQEITLPPTPITDNELL